jgi:tripartite-type tricarboxylate transporter receptor subunit TctC
LEVQGWAALLAPKGSIPEDGLTRLEILLTQALSSEVVKNRFMALNVSPVIQSRQATAIFLRNESSRYGKIIKDRAIKPD